MRRRGALLALGLAFAALPADAREPVAADVRIFEIRRVTSDFSPVEGLRFLVRTDGEGVRLSEWLATLARRVPDAYPPQLAPLRFAGEAGEQVLLRGRRRLAVRVRRQATRPLSVEVRLLRDDQAEQEMRRDIEVSPGATVIVSGRDFELSPSRYLSWFREPGDLDEREALYERLRDRTIFLAVGVTLRAPGREAEPPVPLDPPEAARLLALESPLIGAAEGMVRLDLTLDEEGAPEHIEVRETTLPEVVPRVLGIVGGWRFPESASRVGTLDLRVATR